MLKSKVQRISLISGLVLGLLGGVSNTVAAATNSTSTLAEIELTSDNEQQITAAPHLKFGSANLEDLQKGKQSAISFVNTDVEDEGYHGEVGDGKANQKLEVTSNFADGTTDTNWKVSLAMTKFVNASKAAEGGYKTLEIDSMQVALSGDGAKPATIEPDSDDPFKSGESVELIASDKIGKTDYSVLDETKVQFKQDDSNASLTTKDMKKFQSKLTWTYTNSVTEDAAGGNTTEESDE